MIYLVALAAALAGIVLLLLWQRTNAAVVFFGLCAGSVLAQQVSGDATLLSSSAVHSSYVTNSTVQIVLIVLPALLSALAMRKTVANSHLIVNLLPALCVAALATILIVPLLSFDLRYNLQSTIIWEQLNRASELVVIAGVITSIVALWIGTHKKHHKKHH